MKPSTKPAQTKGALKNSAEAAAEVWAERINQMRDTHPQHFKDGDSTPPVLQATKKSKH